MVEEGAGHHRRRRRIDAAGCGGRCPRTRSCAACCRSSSGWLPRVGRADLRRHLQGRRRARGDRSVARRSSTTSAAFNTTPGMAAVAAETGAALILMHNRGRSREMYREAAYDDVMAEVCAELGAAMQQAIAAGVRRESIVLDPGLGFAKRAEHTYAALADFDRLVAARSPDPLGTLPQVVPASAHWASTRPTSGTGARRPPSPRASSWAPTSSVSTTCPPCATS